MYAAITVFVFLAAILPTYAVCPSGWIAVGQSQTCQVTIDPASCTDPVGAIFTNGCDIIAENGSVDGDWCDDTSMGGYNNGASVDCEGGYQTQPYYITTSGGYFGNCEAADSDDAVACYGFDIDNPVAWCCSPS